MADAASLFALAARSSSKSAFGSAVTTPEHSLADLSPSRASLSDCLDVLPSAPAPLQRYYSGTVTGGSIALTWHTFRTTLRHALLVP